MLVDKQHMSGFTSIPLSISIKKYEIATDTSPGQETDQLVSGVEAEYWLVLKTEEYWIFTWKSTEFGIFHITDRE